MSIFSLFRARTKRNELSPHIERGFRGEGVTYRLNGRTIEIDFTWCNGDRLYTETIDKWDDGHKLSDEEKQRVFLDVLKYLSRPLRRTIVVINTDDSSLDMWNRLSADNAKLVKAVEFTSIDEQKQFERQMYLDILNSKSSLVINDVQIHNESELDDLLTQTRKI